MTDESSTEKPHATSSHPLSRPSRESGTTTRPADRANPFVSGSVLVGIILLFIGTIVVAVNLNSAVRGYGGLGVPGVAAGAGLTNVGGLLILIAVVIAGFDWSIRNRR